MLNKDTLGIARAAAKASFSGKNINEVIMMYGGMEGLRIAMEKADSEAIINHLKVNAKLNVPGTPMTAGPYPVTGLSITGTIE